jgi:hypothetical protein
MRNLVYEIEKKYLFGRPDHVMMLEHIRTMDGEWFEQFSTDLSISPQRTNVVIDCIEWKFTDLTSVNK